MTYVQMALGIVTMLVGAVTWSTSEDAMDRRPETRDDDVALFGARVLSCVLILSGFSLVVAMARQAGWLP